MGPFLQELFICRSINLVDPFTWSTCKRNCKKTL